MPIKIATCIIFRFVIVNFIRFDGQPVKLITYLIDFVSISPNVHIVDFIQAVFRYRI
uniref:Uncharacterized protein n=1 Tax=Syphacia muris TaxID=451379 RepID=A0A0N5AI90_9BILA